MDYRKTNNLKYKNKYLKYKNKYLKYKNKYLNKKTNKFFIVGGFLPSTYIMPNGRNLNYYMNLLGSFLNVEDFVIDSIHDKLIIPGEEPHTTAIPQIYDESTLIKNTLQQENDLLGLILSTNSKPYEIKNLNNSDKDFLENDTRMKNLLNNGVLYIDAGPSGFKSLKDMDKQPWSPKLEENWFCGDQKLDKYKIGSKYNTNTFSNIFDSATIGMGCPVCILTLCNILGVDHPNKIIKDYYSCLIEFLKGNFHSDCLYLAALNYLNNLEFQISINQNNYKCNNIKVTHSAWADKTYTSFFVSQSLCAEYINALSGSQRAQKRTETGSIDSNMLENIYKNIISGFNGLSKEDGVKIFRILKYMGDKSHIVWSVYLLYIDNYLRQNASIYTYDEQFDIFNINDKVIKWFKEDSCIILLTIDRLLLKSLIDIINKINDSTDHSDGFLQNINNRLCGCLARTDGSIPISCTDLSLYKSILKQTHEIMRYIVVYKPENPQKKARLNLLEIYSVLNSIPSNQAITIPGLSDMKTRLLELIDDVEKFISSTITTFQEGRDISIVVNRHLHIPVGSTVDLRGVYKQCLEISEINNGFNRYNEFIGFFEYIKNNIELIDNGDYVKHYEINQSNKIKKKIRNKMDKLSKCPFQLGLYSDNDCISKGKCMEYKYDLSIYTYIINNLEYYYEYLLIDDTFDTTKWKYDESIAVIKDFCYKYIDFIKSFHDPNSDINTKINGLEGLVVNLKKPTNRTGGQLQFLDLQNLGNNRYAWKTVLQQDISNALHSIYNICFKINSKIESIGSEQVWSEGLNEYIPKSLLTKKIDEKINEKFYYFKNKLDFIKSQFKGLIVDSSSASDCEMSGGYCREKTEMTLKRKREDEEEDEEEEEEEEDDEEEIDSLITKLNKLDFTYEHFNNLYSNIEKIITYIEILRILKNIKPRSDSPVEDFNFIKYFLEKYNSLEKFPEFSYYIIYYGLLKNELDFNLLINIKLGLNLTHDELFELESTDSYVQFKDLLCKYINELSNINELSIDILFFIKNLTSLDSYNIYNYINQISLGKFLKIQLLTYFESSLKSKDEEDKSETSIYLFGSETSIYLLGENITKIASLDECLRTNFAHTVWNKQKTNYTQIILSINHLKDSCFLRKRKKRFIVNDDFNLRRRLYILIIHSFYNIFKGIESKTNYDLDIKIEDILQEYFNTNDILDKTMDENYYIEKILKEIYIYIYILSVLLNIYDYDKLDSFIIDKYKEIITHDKLDISMDAGMMNNGHKFFYSISVIKLIKDIYFLINEHREKLEKYNSK